MNNKIKKYFEDLGIDLNEIFDLEDKTSVDALIESILDPDLKEIISKISNIQSSNNTHKILFAAGLLELRMQVKKNQEQLSEMRRQIEKGFKENKFSQDTILKNQETHMRDLNLLQEPLDKVSRMARSVKTT